MFDDAPQKNTSLPENLPTEPMDMFAETEGEVGQAPPSAGPSALSAGVLKPKQASVHAPTPIGAQAEPTEIYAVSKPVLGKIIFVIIFILFFAGVGFGAWKLYSYLNAPDKQTPEVIITQPIVNEAVDDQAPLTPSDYADYDNPDMLDNTIDSDMPVVVDEQETESTSTTTIIVPDFIVDSIDSDGDGLLDGAEVTFKTDSFNPDTDADGLTDGDEVLIWKTNPLNPDSDGDGFKDGDEVRNGYNPLGPGKLFEGQNVVTTSASEDIIPTNEEPAI